MKITSKGIEQPPLDGVSFLGNANLFISVKVTLMKALLALASGWIAFYLADQAIYDGHHVRLFAGFIRAIGVGFGYSF